MKDHYAKRGAVVRWENGAIVHVIEAGEAWFEGEAFVCRPADGPRPMHVDAAPVSSFAEAVIARVPDGVIVERLVAVDGESEHACGDRRWSERTRRVAAAFLSRGERLLVDTATFDVAAVASTVEAFARMEDEITVESILIAPAVTAAILPSLFRRGFVRCEQRAGGIDGSGFPVIDAAPGEAWPNVWRPSYRVAPVRAPHNLSAVPFGEFGQASVPRAVALLSPRRRGTVRVLVEYDGRIAPADMVLRPARAVAAPGEWYPFEAGSFGTEMVL